VLYAAGASGREVRPSAREFGCTLNLKGSMRLKILETLLAMGVLGGTLLVGLQHPALEAHLAEGHFDFISFYAAGQIVRDGRAAELFQRQTQDEYQKRVCGRAYALLFYHPPFEALLFVPLAFLPYRTAYQLWAFINLALVFAAAWLLRTFLGTVEQLGLRITLVVTFLFPFLVAVVQGQDSLLLLLVYSGAVASLKQRRELRGGCLLALGLFRPQLVVPFVVPFLLKRRWKFVGGFAAVATILAAVSVGLVGWHGVADWLGMIRAENVDLAVGTAIARRTVHPADMANLRGLFSAALLDRIPEIWVNAISLGASGLLFVGILFLWKGELDPLSRRFDRVMAATVTGILLISHHQYAHDLSLILLPLALSFSAIEGTPRQTRFGGSLLVGASLALPLSFLYALTSEQRAGFVLSLPLLLILAFILLDMARLRALTSPCSQP
jgi:hypothetical protein